MDNTVVDSLINGIVETAHVSFSYDNGVEVSGTVTDIFNFNGNQYMILLHDDTYESYVYRYENQSNGGFYVYDMDSAEYQQVINYYENLIANERDFAFVKNDDEFKRAFNNLSDFIGDFNI